eukprot:TRINITY_DN14632_c0_g1_i1.p1 TRINITY_DN14632_c0_g1~~TRINITY_DN14632_c0_g1_i1.p1  ORF type:complete len:237 (+),score=59.14 TRINITY_DN14632_c0_g1_i1:33-743(+)
MDLYSVIMPTFNEKDNLPIMVWLLDRMFTKNKLNYEIIVVDDNSPDGTQGVAKQLQKIYGEQHVVLKPRSGKLGLGSAYKYGLTFARGSFVIIMDADMSHHPDAIPTMIAKQKKENLDIVSGNRYVSGGGVHGWNLTRKLTSRVANFLAYVMLSPPEDATGSFRLYRAHVIKQLLDETVSTGYTFQMEMLVRAIGHGFSVGQVPITFVDRVFGESKMGANEVVGYLKGLWALAKTT